MAYSTEKKGVMKSMADTVVSTSTVIVASNTIATVMSSILDDEDDTIADTTSDDVVSTGVLLDDSDKKDVISPVSATSGAATVKEEGRVHLANVTLEPSVQIKPKQTETVCEGEEIEDTEKGLLTTEINGKEYDEKSVADLYDDVLMEEIDDTQEIPIVDELIGEPVDLIDNMNEQQTLEVLNDIV